MQDEVKVCCELYCATCGASLWKELCLVQSSHNINIMPLVEMHKYECGRVRPIMSVGNLLEPREVNRGK